MTMIARENIIESTPNLVNEIFEGVAQGSKILPLMTKLPDMSKSKESLPVLSLLPEAYWVSGDNGLKGTSKMAWDKKYIYAEEIAVVVPIPESVLADADYDIIGQAKPRIIEAFYKKIDEAIISGKNKPARFRDDLVTSITSAGNTVSATGTLYEQISNAMGKVEEDGYDVNGIVGGVGLKKAFRDGFVDKNGQPLNASEVTEISRSFVNNGAWDKTKAKFIVGDFTQAVYSYRSDIEFKLFDSGVVTDAEGNIIYNLMQQDMVALRCTLRMGWELPNPVNAENSDNATRFPFALVTPEA
jgi:HK97 family phage major capsid protein